MYSSGSAGINATKPAQTLTVQGTLNVTASGGSNVSIFVPSTGNVGINETNPKKTFHVSGDFNITTPDMTKSIAMNQSCSIITGPTSELAIC